MTKPNISLNLKLDKAENNTRFVQIRPSINQSTSMTSKTRDLIREKSNKNKGKKNK